MKKNKFILVAIVFVLQSEMLFAKQFLVSSVQELNNIKKNVQPGDSIIFSDKTWMDAVVELNFFGTSALPIYILPQTKGKVIFSGSSSLKISGAYIIIDGFVFRNITSKSTVIQFRIDKNKLANHCRVTNSVIDNCNPLDRLAESNWVVLFGRNNRFDHNTIINKKNLGVTLVVELNDSLNQHNYHRIDHNYFGPRARGGSNGSETIRVGNSTFSKSTSGTIIEENYFDKCNGEVEIISIKACDNILRKNTFFECEGGLVLRHGDRNLVEENFFIGNNKIHTGGVRIINADHIVRKNVFINSAGERFRSALAILNGVPNSPLNRYDQVKNVTVEGNIFINCSNIEFCSGKDFERTARPQNIKFQNNIIYSDKISTSIKVNDKLDGFQFQKNYTNSNSVYPVGSFSKKTIKLVSEGDDYIISLGEETIRLKQFATLSNTGTDWSSKETVSSQRIGKIIYVIPGENTIAEAVRSSSPNDVIVLEEAKEYRVSNPIIIKHPLTIRANKTFLQFAGERSISFFEIENGGSLHLNGLIMNGTSDNGVAASFISAGKEPMLDLYNLTVIDCEFRNLTDGRKHAFIAGKGSFADTLSFTNCIFDNITGDVINVAAEKDDIGRYNAEYIIFENCLFNKVLQGSINIYRGGNDESTSGPYFYMNHCTFNQCSNTELGFVIRLHGVQFSSIKNSVFNNSGRSGRAVWYEDFGWTKHSLDYSVFYESGKITSFYPGILGKHNFYVNPKLNSQLKASNPDLLKASSDKKYIGYNY